MESEKYRKFLERQAEKNPVKIEKSLKSGRFRISWENREERPASNSSSDILDSLYLGREMQETVVVDRRVAAMLQDRLRGLEEENISMHKRIKTMKLIIAALLAAVISVSLFLLNMYLPQIQIML